MHQKRLAAVGKAMIKQMGHCTACYKMEQIYVQTRLKGQGSPELALEERKKQNERLRICNFYRLLFGQFVFMNVLGLACLEIMTVKVRTLQSLLALSVL